MLQHICTNCFIYSRSSFRQRGIPKLVKREIMFSVTTIFMNANSSVNLPKVLYTHLIFHFSIKCFPCKRDVSVSGFQICYYISAFTDVI